ncbi:hypothetical protein ACQ4PT_010624 [Festuca glaucescens]
MGRGKVVLQRIENKISRQVTFAKRRNGLLKKAYELSVLCDAEVALVLFSHAGRLYQFSSSSNMLKTLERYQRYIFASQDAVVPTSDEMQNNYLEYMELKARVEVLQHSQRNLLGEDLAPLNASELDQLESQVGKTLRQIRSRKLDEMEVDAAPPPPPQQQQLPWQSDRGVPVPSHAPPQPDHFFQALECNPSLQPE